MKKDWFKISLIVILAIFAIGYTVNQYSNYKFREAQTIDRNSNDPLHLFDE